jgi:hypothetical protein
MKRLPRIDIPGLPHHLNQRGNRRSQVFFEEGDYERYLDLLSEAPVGSGTEIWCFWDALRARRTRCRWHPTPVGAAVRRCAQIPDTPASSCGLAWTLRLASGKTGENRGKPGKTGENRGKPGKTGDTGKTGDRPGKPGTDHSFLISTLDDISRTDHVLLLGLLPVVAFLRVASRCQGAPVSSPLVIRRT